MLDADKPILHEVYIGRLICGCVVAIRHETGTKAYIDFVHEMSERGATVSGTTLKKANAQLKVCKHNKIT